MVTKKRSGATAKKTTRRRKNYGYDKIPMLAAVIGAAYDRRMFLKHRLDMISQHGIEGVKNTITQSLQPENLKGFVRGGLTGYAVGYAAKELIPNTGIGGKLKKAVGGIAKKVL